MLDHPHQLQKRYQSFSDLEKIQQSEIKYQNSRRPRYQQSLYLNQYQYEIYKTAMYGLSMYSSGQLRLMSFQKKRKIRKFYKKVQRVLNLWKQQLINQLFEQLCSLQLNKFPQNPFSTVFRDTAIGVEKFDKITDDLFRCDITFEQLKVNRQQIIQKLINEQLLPSDFFQLTK